MCEPKAEAEYNLWHAKQIYFQLCRKGVRIVPAKETYAKDRAREGKENNLRKHFAQFFISKLKNKKLLFEFCSESLYVYIYNT